MEEFPAVRRSKNGDCGQRLIDGIIILNEPNRVAHWKEVEIEGKDIIVLQTKEKRLGMYLMGQTLFSMCLMEKFNPSKITSVALCRYDDSIMRPLLEKHEGCKVVII